MFQDPPLEKKWHTWLFFVSWSLLILRLGPLTRPLLRQITDLVGRNVLIYGTIAVTALAGLIGVIYVLRNPRMRSFSNAFILLAVVAAYAWICTHELQAAQEALHFLEYGFLGLLAFRALSHRLRDITIYPMAVLLCGLVGNMDENLQWLEPGRIWDIRDWVWDMVAAALAQIAIAGGMRPLFIRWKIPARSWRMLLRLLALQVLLMGLCFSMTPSRCVWIGHRVPLLRFLTWQTDVMAEYGYLHHDAKIGSFYSRFTIDELRHLDDTRFEDAAEIIRQYRDGPGFAVFVREINSGVDPFVHEAYVHINRRNHYRDVSPQYRENNKAAYTYHCTVSYREDQILEKYFPKTTGFAGEAFSAQEFDRLRQGASTDQRYTSPVSDHLMTRFSEEQVRLIFLLALVLILAADYRLSRHA